MKRLAALTLLLVLWAAPAAFGQGCIMCYEGARGASTGGQNALSRGVLVLLAPPIGIMTMIVGFAFVYRRNDEEPESGENQAESDELL